MRMKFVTSMNQEIADNIGNEMLEGYLKYWPQESTMHVYSEDEQLKAIEHPRITYYRLQDTPGYNEFQSVMSTFPIFNGIVDNRRYYQYDLARFSKKVFAQIDAANEYPGYLFWLDSDVHTLNSIPASALENWMQGHFMCVMRRKTWHICTSFVGWDGSHKHAAGFWQTYYTNYLSGKVLLLPQWEDCTVLENTIEGLDGIRDLGEKFEGEGPYNVFDMVFEGFAVHFKGPLAKEKAKEIIKKSNEEAA